MTQDRLLSHDWRFRPSLDIEFRPLPFQQAVAMLLLCIGSGIQAKERGMHFILYSGPCPTLSVRPINRVSDQSVGQQYVIEDLFERLVVAV